MKDQLLSEIEKIIDKKFTNTQKEILDISDAAFMLGLAKQTLYKMNHRKVIPYFKPSGSKKVYYHRQSLVDYMTENRFMSKSEMEAKTQSYFQNKRGGGFV
jgi:predicted DNA-binding transcriptional regulator AlpA